ncbi:MAG TPA: penicillin-binding protein 2 [Propionibacteriaceae bacterium]|nr:penicillin-binding protein 2 [Propionibacteriaceae bacterium]
MPLGSPKRRLQVALVVLGLLATLLASRAIVVQGLDSAANAAKAAALMSVSRTLVANRGTITDRNGEVLASSQPAVTIVADPTQIATNGKLASSMTAKDKEKAAGAPSAIADVLVSYLGGDHDSYVAQLTKPDTKYVVIAKKVQAYTYLQIANKLSDLGYVGLHRETAAVRTYPNGTLASNVLGFVRDSDDGVGQVGAGGLEYAYNMQLAGVAGSEMYETSPNGKIPTGQNVLVPAQDGVTYNLTLDAGLQYMVESRLQETVDQARAKSGIAIVMNVKTGEILSLANYPSFDSNSPGTALAANLGNRAITDAYEPGSVEKVLTMAALTDSGTITPDTRVIVPSQVMSGGKPIKDAFPHNTINLTARGIVANSSNIGTVLLTRQMDKAKLVTYLQSFGLGATTGLGLPGEATGSLPSTSLADNTRDQISFGQGLSVTAVQEAAAVAGIVNGGVYNSPTIIKSAVGQDGKAVPVPVSTSRRVISPESSAMVLDMMESVVASKVGVNRFPIDGYRTADKSGTAERIDPTCKCYNGYVASFIGVAPVEDPSILVYVVVDRPQGAIQGSQVAAPAYKDIMRVALQRYGVLPSTTPARVEPIEW